MPMLEREQASGPLAGDARAPIAAGLAAVAIALLLVGPRAAPWALVMLLVACLLWQPGEFERSLGEGLPGPFLVALLFGGYLVVNSLWAVDRVAALGKSALFLASVGSLLAASQGLKRAPAGALQRVGRGMVIAFALAVAYLLVEEVSNHFIKQSLYNSFPSLRPDPKHISLDGDLITQVARYVSNRNMAVAHLVLWPVLLCCVALLGGWARRAACVGLVGVLGWAVSLSLHETSMIALVLSLLVFAAARFWPRLALGLLAAGWAVSTLLVVPMVSQAYKAGFYTDKRLPLSARHRVILWGYTAEQWAKKPWLGVGVDSTKPLDAASRHEQPADHPYPRRTGTHGHNLYLQAWYELGAVGGVLLLALGLAALAGLWRLEEQIRPYGLATFSVAAVMAAFSWGMWQPWYMAAFAIAALTLLMAAEMERRREPARA